MVLNHHKTPIARLTLHATQKEPHSAPIKVDARQILPDRTVASDIKHDLIARIPERFDVCFEASSMCGFVTKSPGGSWLRDLLGLPRFHWLLDTLLRFLLLSADVFRAPAPESAFLADAASSVDKAAICTPEHLLL